MDTWSPRRFQITHAFEHGMYLRRLAAQEALGTILYIHGLGESALCFERLMADHRLRRWNHLAPDLIGYGKSSWSSAPLKLEQQAERLDALLEDLGSDPVVLVGHSMGGVIGTLLAHRAPRRVRAFLNVEGTISSPDCHFSSRAASYTAEDWLGEGYGVLLDGLYREASDNPEVLRPYCASIQMCDPRAFHKNSRELVEASAEETLARRLAAVEAPKVYLFGAPRGTCDASRALLRDAGVKMVGIPDAGHWPFLDQPDAFVDETVRFLTGLVPA